MEFCPMCGSLLMLQLHNNGTRFNCNTCPYDCPIPRGVKIKRKQLLVRKGIDPILSYDDMKNAPISEETCPACRNGKAAFTLLQTRSCDEPGTQFFACLNEECKHRWTV